MVTVASNMPTVFEEAIRKNPNDLRPRLIFADWLENQELPQMRARSELIRIQCE